MCSGCARHGMPVAIGHAAKNLGKARVVVVSSAIQPDNPELLAARARRLPVVRRADMLAELMRLKRADRGRRHPRQDHDHRHDRGPARRRRPRPDRRQWRHHQRLRHQRPAGPGRLDRGRGRRERRQLPAPAGRPSPSSPTSIPEHMEHYGSFDALRDAFHAFVERVPFYGFAALCIDHPEVQALYRPGHRPARRDLRLQPAGRRPRPATASPRPTARCSTSSSAPRTARASGGWSGCSSRCRACTTSPTPWPPSWSRASWASPTRWSAAHAGRPRGRQAPLHPYRRRSTASASSTTTATIRSRSRPCCATARARAAGRVIAVVQPHRYTPPRQPVRGFLHLLPRCRHGAGGAGLCRRRAADRGCRAATRWSRASAGTATATCAPDRRPRRSGAADRGDRPAR